MFLGEKLIIDGWDCSMQLDPGLVPKRSPPDLDLQQLLKGFFQFMSELDFVNNVVITRTGSVADKKGSNDKVRKASTATLFALSRSSQITKWITPVQFSHCIHQGIHMFLKLFINVI